MSGTVEKKYLTEKGNVFYVRLDDNPGAQLIAGQEPAQAVTEAILLKASARKNQYGLRPRLALFSRPIGGNGTATQQYSDTAKAYKRIPVLQAGQADRLQQQQPPPTLQVGGVIFTFQKIIPEITKR